jgi:hypothetical protein
LSNSSPLLSVLLLLLLLPQVSELLVGQCKIVHFHLNQTLSSSFGSSMDELPSDDN